MADRGKFPVRKKTRLQNYDYSSPNYYFITICCSEMKCLFGRPGVPNTMGLIAQEAILRIPQHFANARVDKHIIMPNHIHAIVVLQGKGASLPLIVGQYKSYVTRQIRKTRPGIEVWQTSFHDHIIRNQKEYESIWLYIDANPQNWEKDEHFTPL